MNFEEYKKNVQNNGNSTMFARDSYSNKMVPLKDVNSLRKPFERPGAFNPDLDTPEGLLNLSNQVGLGDEAKRMVRKSGGESQKFFSGGFVMDAMDILNIGSYGVAGLVKGKGFAEGVKNRESFSDEDSLGKYGWGGKIAGFALDIALDPLTYVAPWKHISKIPGVVKASNRAKGALFGELKTVTIEGQEISARAGGWTPTRLLADKLVYGNAVDKKFLDGYEKIVGHTDAMAGKADNLVGMFSKLDPTVLKKTLTRDESGRFFSTNLAELQRTMSPDELKKVTDVYKMRDDMMERLTNLGVVSKETADEHWGRYLKQSYEEFMTAKNTVPGKKGIGIEKKGRVEGLTPEKADELGHIKDPSVIWGTTLLKQADLIRRAELNHLTAKGFSMTADNIPDYVKQGGKDSDLHLVSDTAAHAGLGGKYVSKEVWGMLKGTFDPTKEVGESLVLKFKHMKVVWNPGSHARNAVTSHIQNWWRMGIGPWRSDLYHDARKEIANKGKAFREMEELGFSERSGQIGELVESHLTRDVIGEQVQSQLGGSIRGVKKVLKHMDKVLTNSYGHTDNVAKVVAYKYGIKKGMKPEDALKAAYEATYNYSQITPFVHQMRRAIWGVPFITFAIKSVPLVASTLKHAPHRISVFGKARNDLFKAAGVDAEQEAEAMPDYMRDDMFVMRLPWKDKKDRPMYFDMSYIIPFGSIMNGDYAKDPITNNPVLQTVRELSKNRTFSGSKIFNESDDMDTVIADVFIHISKLGLPPIATDMLSDGYDESGTRKHGKLSKFATQDTQDMGPNERSFYQEMFRLVGLGVSPYDIDSKERQLAYKQKENLTQLLVENDVLNEFRSPYLPKDSPLKKESFGGRDSKTIGR